MLVFLQTLPGAINHLEPIVDLLLHFLGHIGISHFNTVYLGLVLKELLHSYLFGYRTIGIPTPLHTFHRGLDAHLLNVGSEDGLIAYNPYDLINNGADGVLGCRCHPHERNSCQHGEKTIL